MPSTVAESRIRVNALCVNNPEAQQYYMAVCQRDIVFWVQHFCWCFEPRDMRAFPIELYDYQRWALRVWHDILTFDNHDFLVDKCRDMGITWMLLYLFLYFWLFRAQSTFLISTYREQDVDTAGNMATMFPKLRFAVDHLPEWMLPKGYTPKIHASYMKLQNPENGSVIIGSAPVPNYGRSGRYLAVLFDEMAQWLVGGLAWDACSQTTRCRIGLSTPFGRANRFAQLRNPDQGMPQPIVRIFEPAA